MMQAKTIMIQQHTTEGRFIIAHFTQIIYDDNGLEMGRSKDPHTITLAPDSNYQEVLEANNQDITTREGMEWEPISEEEWGRVLGHCQIEHTTEIKKAFVAWKASEELKGK